MVLSNLFLPTAYPFGTQIYILLAQCLYLWYSYTFYWLPVYPYGTLLSSTGSLPITVVLYYLLLSHCLNLWYSIIFRWPLSIPLVPYYLLLAKCLYLWYSTVFFWLPAYSYCTLPSSIWLPDGTLLPSTYSLPIPMLIYYLLLAPCLSLWYPTSFYWPTAYPFDTLLFSTGFLPISMILFYILQAHCLSLWYSYIF